MPDIYVISDGKALHPSRKVDADALAKIPVGVPHKAKVSKPRNRKVHNLYFAVIAAAAKQWPEHEEPTELNANANMLRNFLQCKAGWCVRIDFDPSDKDSVIKLLEAVRDEDKYAFVKGTVSRDGEPKLSVYISKSVSFTAAEDEIFNPIKTEVLSRIEAVLGCSVETLIDSDLNEA
jgi:hypothetical protein